MKLATFEVDGVVHAGSVEGDRVSAFADGVAVVDVLGGEAARLGAESWALGEVTLLAPVPEPGTIYAIGLNYAKHVEETGATKPEQPIVFVKVLGSRGAAGRPDPLP